uniref:RIKEN cDNA 2810408A11 gene n=1 Tax=Jaculus jaculus TaxID=51337 RepID=A0A8C5NUR0_JACJA
MEQPESSAAASGLRVALPGEAIRRDPRGLGGAGADTELPSSGASVLGSGPPLQSWNPVTRSPGSSRPSAGTVAQASGPSRHVGEVVDHSLGSYTSSGGFSVPCPGTSGSSPGPAECKVYNSGYNSSSRSTCLHPHNYEAHPRSILKNNGSVLMQKYPSKEKKAQHWDEMNILATYHPADKDYGLKKVDEPNTPYHRLQGSDEDLSAEYSLKVTPELLAERFAKMDSFLPKVLQYGDETKSEATDNFSKTYFSDFEKHRKTHYNEGKFLKAQKNLPLANAEDSSGASASGSSEIQGGRMDPMPRTSERGWAGRLARGVKDETGLVTDSQALDTRAACAYRNQFPAASAPKVLDQMDLQHKEYYSESRYLRSCSQPEPEEDTDEQQDKSLEGHTGKSSCCRNTTGLTSSLQMKPCGCSGLGKRNQGHGNCSQLWRA